MCGCHTQGQGEVRSRHITPQPEASGPGLVVPPAERGPQCGMISFLVCVMGTVMVLPPGKLRGLMTAEPGAQKGTATVTPPLCRQAMLQGQDSPPVSPQTGAGLHQEVASVSLMEGNSTGVCSPNSISRLGPAGRPLSRGLHCLHILLSFKRGPRWPCTPVILAISS